MGPAAAEVGERETPAPCPPPSQGVVSGWKRAELPVAMWELTEEINELVGVATGGEAIAGWAIPTGAASEACAPRPEIG